MLGARQDFHSALGLTHEEAGDRLRGGRDRSGQAVLAAPQVEQYGVDPVGSDGFDHGSRELQAGRSGFHG
jgi:hypothetical protein